MMNVLPYDREVLRAMSVEDLDAVMAVEQDAYPFPWSRGNFSDSLSAGYSCWIFEAGEALVGYAVLMLAAGEAHLLNLTIASEWQRQGMGRRLLEHLIGVARKYCADTLFLEVRPSNRTACRLYESAGFNEMGRRRGYYPAGAGREDAVLMGLAL